MPSGMASGTGLGSGDGLAQELLRDFNKLRDNRGTFESHWTEIAERVIPSHSYLFQNYGFNQTKGDKRTTELFDSTALVALDRFSSILDSMLTPRNQTWHRLTASNENLTKQREVRLWFEKVNSILFKARYAPDANFSAQNQQNYSSLGAYGTGCVFVDSHLSGRGLRYKNIHLSEIFFRENHQGIIDEAYRYFRLMLRQAVKKWPDTLPSDLKDKLANDPDEEFFFLHAVRPRKNFDPERLDSKGLPFESFYISEHGQAVLEEGGFHSFPYSISRYFQTTGEVYGRSPAMSVLPAIKTLNEEKKTLLKQGHRVVDPVLLAHDDGVLDSFSLLPGRVNFGGVNANGVPLVHALPVGNLSIGRDLMEDERQLINDTFLVTLFQILVETPTMTATEVLERTREKGILLAPTIGRQQSEYLGPMVTRELDLLALQPGVLPPMPPALLEAQGEYEVVYDSPLSRAQRAEEAAGANRAIEQSLAIVNATQDPKYLDHYNFDVIIPENAKIQGTPESWMHGPSEIQRLRQARAQQAQLQQAIEAAPGVAALQNAETKRASGA